MMSGDRCVSCDEPLRGGYCHACGEKRADERDLTVPAFLRYAVAALTNSDAKLYRTARTLVTKPGLLTREFVAGRRKPYVGPLQLFLVVNLVYFLLLQLGWGTNALTTDLAYHRTQPVYGSVADRMMQERLGPWPERLPEQSAWGWVATWSEEQLDFRRRFNQASPRYANSLVLLMVPLFALATRLLRRRGLMVRELVFSLSFFTFTMLVLIVLPLPFVLFYLAAPGWARYLESELASALPVSALLVLYLALAFQRAHGDSRFSAVLRGLVSMPLLFLVVTLYRGVLFFVVFWAVR